MKTGWKAHSRFEPMWGGCSLWIFHEDQGGRFFVKSLEMQKVECGEYIDPSTQAIKPNEAEDFMRAVMDAAWDLGIRPTGYENHENELKATRYHLEDMRSLALLKGEQADG